VGTACLPQEKRVVDFTKKEWDDILTEAVPV